MSRALAGAGVLAVLAYPLLAHGAALLDSHRLALLAIALLAPVLLAPGLRRGAPAAWIVLAVLLAALAWLWNAGATLLLLYLPPVLLNALVAWVFGRSLRPGRTPLVERIATVLHGAPLEPPVQAYVRRVTLGWTLLLAGLALANLVLALLARPDGLLLAAGIAPPFTVPRSSWSLFANLLNYLIVALAFAAEFLWRRHRFPAHARGGLAGFAARVLRLGPGFWRGR